MTPKEQEDAAKAAQAAEIDQILNKDFKQFVDSARLYIADSYFALRLNVGPQGFTYVLTPFLAKKLMEIFVSQVALYEKIVRPIPTAPPSLSPIQSDDLQGSGDQGVGLEDSGKKPEGPKKPKGKK